MPFRLDSLLNFFFRQRHYLVRFALVGAANTLVDIMIYYSITRGLGLTGTELIWVKGLSFLLATIFSFFVNRHFTFRQEGRATWPEFLRFYLAVGSAVFLNMVAVYLLHLIVGLHDLLAVLLSTGLTFLWSFSFSRLWVFAEKK